MSQARRGGGPSMMEFWSQFEEQLLDGQFPLRQYLGNFETGAVFLSQLDERQHQRVAVKIIRSGSSQAQGFISSWNLAKGLEHPNLVRVYATAHANLGGLRVVYAVTDYPDESLERVLGERGLTEAEARELLLNSAEALHFLHAKGLIHAQLQPSAIVAVDEAIKLTSDHLTPIGVGISPASDVWGLGATLFQALTQRPPAAEDPVGVLSLPAPFSEILPHCLDPDPKKRWTPRAIAASLVSASPQSAPARKQASRKGVLSGSRGSRGGKWQVAFAALAVLAAVWLTETAVHSQRAIPTRSSSGNKAAQDGPVPLPLAGKPAPQEAPAPAPKAAPEPAQPHSIWRVVVYTYSTEASAERKAAAINQESPNLRASAFSATGHPPVLVVVGGRMNRAAATKLRARVVASGFPPDTYISNFSR